MIKLRITIDGSVQSLWTDEIRWVCLGSVHVRRASHVEFDDRRQCWCVREAIPRGVVRRWLQRLLSRPMGRVLHVASSRRSALAWEKEYFQPGGSGWTDILR